MDMIYLYLSLFLGAIYLFYVFYIKPKSLCKYYVKMLKSMGYKVYQYPFIPFGVPIYQSIEHYDQEKGDPFYEAKHHYQGYDVAVGNMVQNPHVVFINLKLGREVLTADKVMILPKVSFLFRILLQKFGEGLVFVEGEKWRSRRKVISKVFTFDFLKELVPQIAEISDEIYDRMELQNKAQGVHNNFRTDLFKLGLRLFSSVTINGFMGMNAYKEKIEDKYVNQQALQVIELAMNSSINPLVIIFGSWIYKLGINKDFRILENKYKLLKDYSKRKLSEIKYNFENMKAEDQKRSNNLVHSLLYQIKEEGETSSYTQEEIIQEIMTFTTAGTDTTSTLFSMSILRIFQFPELEEKVRKQINDTIKQQSDFTFQKLKLITILDLIQLEVLRMHSPAEGIFDRLTTTDTLVGDIPIKKGTALNYFQTADFYNQHLFEDPWKFKPQRWQSKDEKTQELYNLIMLAFSSGPRSCIGKNLAILQSKIAVIKFLQRYKNLKEMNQRVFTVTIAYHLKNNDVSFTTVK